MTNLYIAWQNPVTRQWTPVGRLTRHETAPAEYEFAYTEGARNARQASPLWQVPGFPDIDRLYRSAEMFPAFSDRLMNFGRPDRSEYLTYLDLDVDNWDEVAELAISGARAHSDRFEMFPEIVPDAEGYFASRFVLPGLDQISPETARRANSLKVGDLLELSPDSNGPNGKDIVRVKTNDDHTLGWLPFYLAPWLHQGRDLLVKDFDASVARVNHDAPLSHRLLVDLHGRLPHGFLSMRDMPEFRPIFGSDRVASSANESPVRILAGPA